AVDDFCVHDQRGEGDEIGNELSDMLTFVENFIATLLVERDIAELELNCERVLICLLIQSVADFVQDLHCAAYDLKHFLLQQQFIRVHLCSFVVQLFFISRYSMLSTSAWRLASMMLSSTPTVPHSSVPSVDSMSTRVLAA